MLVPASRFSHELRLGKDLELSRAEAETLRSQVVGADSRTADAMKKVESTWDELSKQREGWRKAEEEQNERLGKLKEASVCLFVLFCFLGLHN